MQDKPNKHALMTTVDDAPVVQWVQQLLEQAASVDVEVNGLSTYWLPETLLPEDQRAGLVLGFAAVPEPAIRAALMRLRQAWLG